MPEMSEIRADRPMPTILVLEDESVSREYLTTLLGYGGYRLLEARRGEDALAIARQEQPDLIVADILMPEMDGYEFVRQLRSDPRIAGSRVIFYTATYHERSAQELAEACGVARVLYKPAEPQAILEAVAGILNLADAPVVSNATVQFGRDHLRLLTDKLYEKVAELEAANTALRASEQRLRQLARRLQAVREEERTRVARELHDQLGQALTALKMNCHWVAARVHPSSGVSEMEQCSIRFIDETMAAVRQLCSDLRPGVLDLGLGAAIEWQAEEFQSRSEITCTVAIDAEEGALDSIRATEMFRVFQEALTNIARHSAATHVEINLKHQGPDLLLSVQDNGKGATASELNSPHALGVLGMRERVALIGGSFSIEGQPQRGTRVQVQVPVRTRGTEPSLTNQGSEKH